MTGENDTQNVDCGSPSTGFLSAGLPIRSKTYQRPSPLRQKLQTSSNLPSSTSDRSPEEVQPRTQPITEISMPQEPIRNVTDTSIPTSTGQMSRCGPNQGGKRLRPGEIRLLHLSPPSSNEFVIAGSLESFTLEASPGYTAISYAWGDRKDMSIILVNGTATPVTTSLWHALMALRKRDQSVWIWADALSINQRDFEELNFQVRIMDSIYSQADTVAICLGSPSSGFRNNSQLAFQFMETIATREPADVTFSMITRDDEFLTSTVHLFERNYWKRLWIMQEVFHAKRADVYCGNCSMALGDIFTACTAFKKFSNEIENSFPAGQMLYTSGTLYSYAQTLTTQGPNTLLRSSSGLSHDPLEILRICRSKLTARPQDKILGVLSLLPRDIRSIFRPDFYLTTQEVFTKIVECVIRGIPSSSRCLDVICESIRYPFHQNSLGLPTWVPDWSHSPDTLSLAATHLSHRRPFQACGTTKSLNLGTSSPSINGNELTIRGFCVGRITARGMAVSTLGRLSDYLMAFLEWRHLLHDDEHYTQSHTAAFCRTLCLGDVPEDVYPTLNRQYHLIGSPEVSISVEAEPFDAELRQTDQWQQATFDLFAHFLEERLGRLPLDEELQSHQKKGRKFKEGRQFLQEYFGDRMMGRCFCLIEGLGSEEGKRYLGMGTGYMGVDDVVVIASRCSTPIVIGPRSQTGRDELIGDIYVDGHMDGELPRLYGFPHHFTLR